MSKKNKFTSTKLYQQNNKKSINKRTVIKVIVCILAILAVVGIYGQRKYKQRQDEKNLVGYTVQNEKFIDSCNLVNVDGFYLGKGTLDGQTHYIFQAEKNNQKSENIDVIDKQVDIYYVDYSNTLDKPGTVKAYATDYVKKDKNGKVVKTQQRYCYKVYIPQNSIKNCGELTTSDE
ncbi:hypothetical protein [Clostridium sp. JS66]|uniref:hypothetical protein n=1 Tax=Clostridium sp. JS66 TaxID=3064705 RepID=UPI00298DF7CD|nr:hypothetical protein [Clostridium sp. JS66]WPC41404.1 hypothetical protein Q6H37_26540 [Clostridium sp. JS66]